MSTSSVGFLAHPKGLSPEEQAKRYTEWAQRGQYDYDLREENYQGPRYAAEFLAKEFPDISSRKNISILDVAAGSGFAAVKLRELGFTKMDALEPSEGMAKLAMDKGLYSQLYPVYLDGSPLPIETNRYDVALICGGLNEGHIPCKGLKDLTRIVKKGGLVMIVMREAYLTTDDEYRNRLEPYMKDMEARGKWVQTSRTVVPRYSFDNDGVIYVFKVVTDD